MLLLYGVRPLTVPGDKISEILHPLSYENKRSPLSDYTPYLLTYISAITPIYIHDHTREPDIRGHEAPHHHTRCLKRSRGFIA